MSVIIVNYKVKALLMQCLERVIEASKGMNVEVFVVDNNSNDGSQEAVEAAFPQVAYIQSGDNLGFAKANNIAIRRSNAKYVLLLNPDVFIQPDCLKQVCRFADNAEKFGALGVRMIDSDGNFLPESKRNRPTLWNSFCKIVGLAKLFPDSKCFASYYNVSLKETEAGRTDVLAGAFMLINREKLGVQTELCEDYFMFGEDVDLSVSILEKGFYNYYLPITVTHLKGKSTNRHSKKYIEAFYGSMSIYFNRYDRCAFSKLLVKMAVRCIIKIKSIHAV